MAAVKELTHPDTLVAGAYPLVTGFETILAGAGVLARGTVLGRVIIGTPAIVATVGNTGTGLPGVITPKAKLKVGAYKLRCITAVQHGGVFSVFDPDGYRLADLTVAVAYDNGHFGITIADDVDFIVGDSFTLTVPLADRKFVAADKASVNGAQVAECILAADVDATLADVTNAPVYKSGQFDKTEVVFGGASTYADHIDQLAKNNIYLVDVSNQ